MKTFVRMTERECYDPQEHRAMIKHRLEAIQYQQKLLSKGVLQYAFFEVNLNRTIMMFTSKTNDEQDWHIKRNPYYAYTDNEVMPIASFQGFMNEAQDYIGEEHFTKGEIRALMVYESKKTVDPDGNYWLAWKTLQPFSPLLSEKDQINIGRKTVEAQSLHAPNDLEVFDHNPIGRSIGILITSGGLEETREHVMDCELYPETTVEFIELRTLKQAYHESEQQLKALGDKGVERVENEFWELAAA